MPWLISFLETPLLDDNDDDTDEDDDDDGGKDDLPFVIFGELSRSPHTPCLSQLNRLSRDSFGSDSNSNEFQDDQLNSIKSCDLEFLESRHVVFL